MADTLGIWLILQLYDRYFNYMTDNSIIWLIL